MIVSLKDRRAFITYTTNGAKIMPMADIIECSMKYIGIKQAESNKISGIDSNI